MDMQKYRVIYNIGPLTDGYVIEIVSVKRNGETIQRRDLVGYTQSIEQAQEIVKLLYASQLPAKDTEPTSTEPVVLAETKFIEHPDGSYAVEQYAYGKVVGSTRLKR